MVKGMMVPSHFRSICGVMMDIVRLNSFRYHNLPQSPFRFEGVRFIEHSSHFACRSLTENPLSVIMI